MINASDIHLRIWDLLDIAIVALLFFQIYRLLRGTIAIRILIGLFLLYSVWWLVNYLEMRLLSVVLGQFVQIGVILIVVIFQPEIRRFLLLIGNSTLNGRFRVPNWIQEGIAMVPGSPVPSSIDAVFHAVQKMQSRKIGALIVISKPDLSLSLDAAVPLNALISEQLLLTIFSKEGPLHDGAVLISPGRIVAAKCVLPLSDSPSTQEYGFRHRAALGITETTRAAAFAVSEENGSLYYAFAGEGHEIRDPDEFKRLLKLHLK